MLKVGEADSQPAETSTSKSMGNGEPGGLSSLPVDDEFMQVGIPWLSRTIEILSD